MLSLHSFVLRFNVLFIPRVELDSEGTGGCFQSTEEGWPAHCGDLGTLPRKVTVSLRRKDKGVTAGGRDVIQAAPASEKQVGKPTSPFLLPCLPPPPTQQRLPVACFCLRSIAFAVEG